MDLVRRRKRPDGRIEVFHPYKNADGYYVMADRTVDAQHNKAINQFYVKDLEAVAARLRRGGVSLRMKGDLTAPPSLISAKEIEIVETAKSARSTAEEDDPFAVFDEWAGEADDKAYAGL